jgi:hypothetical protein
MSTLKSAKIDIYIYDSGNPPTTPQYSVSKNLLSGESTINFELSELIKDYIDVQFLGNYSSAKTSKMVDVQVTRTFTETCGNGTEVTHTETANNRLRYIAFRGYGEMEDRNEYEDSPYYDSNINPTVGKDILISNSVIYHLKDQPIRIPFYNGQDGIHKVQYKKDVTTVKSVILGGSTEKVGADRDDIKADVDTGASQIYRADMTHIRNNSSISNSKEELEFQEVNFVTYNNHKGFEQQIPIEIIEECKFTPFKVTFINKFGALQDLWFFKKRTDEFSVEREDYNKTILTTSSTGVGFDRHTHTSSLLDISTEETFVLNTGFLTEDHNEVIRQLMVTEFCWLHEVNNVSQEPVPVKPISSSFAIKKEINDKLLNFTVEFQYANSYIQNVR